MKKIISTLVLLLCLLIFISCEDNTTKSHVNEKHAMVVSARAEASKIGLEILQKGGNVFDAMIAVEFALSVVYPFSGSIGGGGFMVYRLHDGKIGSLDYREKAPLAAHRDMYLDNNGNVIPNKSTLGGKAIGVPGMVAGLFSVHKKFGSMPMDSLLNPVIKLAKKGFIVTKKQSVKLNEHKSIIQKTNGENSIYTKTYHHEGDTIKNIALANTLEIIREKGKDAFYKGEIASEMVQYIQSKGGIITKEDLEKYQTVWRDPITFKYKDLNVISMAPPSSGGVTLAQIMKMIEPYDLKQMGHNNSKTIQLITEAERRAYADRNYFLGDPDFIQNPIKKLLEPLYLKKRMSDFTFEKASKSENISHGDISFSESPETTHFSIVDSYGNAIATTTTLNGAYGSKLFSSKLGFFFNNEMDDFSIKIGTPNMFGLIGNKANNIAPEKRMLSSMTPTIIEKNGNLFLVVGTPGGSTIITSVLQTILNVYEFDLPMQKAVDAPRFHHQWIPDVITFEPNVFHDSITKKLEGKGYIIRKEDASVIGKVDAIHIENGKLHAGADKRGDDTAVSF